LKPLRVPVDSLEVGEQALDRDASNYVLRVHRVRPGQSLVLFDPIRGTEAVATLMRATAKAATCRIEAIVDSQAVPTHAVTLLQALSKGDKVDRVISDATALGASGIVVVSTSRCVVSFEEVQYEARSRRWQRIAAQSARQCGRGNVPTICGPLEFDASLLRIEHCSLRLVMSPEAPTPLSALLARQALQPVAVFIGPEGGLVPDEERKLEAKGFTAVRLGGFTLRTETAATAVLGVLADWGQS
jgi:16S rRNA (uracil1498-N3)-methyltransferase